MVDAAAVEYMGEPASLDPGVLAGALDPVVFVNGRTLYGGPAEEECRRRLPEYLAQLEAQESSVTSKLNRLARASEEQERAIYELLA